MAQTYTLEEAAQRLGLPIDEFKRRLKTDWTSIRSFRDGATLRYRAADIDELARSLGQASDPALQLGAPGAQPQVTSTDEFLLPEDLPAPVVGGDDSLSDDIFTITSSESPKGKSSGDSDVRLELDSGPQHGSDPDMSMRTEEMNLDLSSPIAPAGVDSGIKLTAPKSGYNLAGNDTKNRIPGPPSSESVAGNDSSSEFELSLDPDSDSFEIQLNPQDGSEEVELGTLQGTTNVQSGINLAKPSDGGVSLEGSDDSSSEFELSLDSDQPAPAPSSGRMKGTKIPTSQAADSDSEFELTLDDNSSVGDAVEQEVLAENQQGDIFETDFELPAVSADDESGSEAIPVESSDTDLENSDFDIALDESDISADDESASQVVLLDEESDSDSGESGAVTPGGGRGAALAAGALAAGAVAAGAAAAAGRRRPKVDHEDSDEHSAGAALRGVRGGADEDDEEGTSARSARPTNWGLLPVVVLVPTLLVSFLGSIMSYEAMKGMWSYHNGQQPSGALVRSIAGMLDMEPK